MSHLILASGSVTRRALLARLGLEFEVQVPDIEEKILPDESFMDYVTRLSVQKAAFIAQKHPYAWVLGSDQICVCRHQLFEKPLTLEKAAQQLQFLSGQSAFFYTGVCLMNQHSHQSFLDVVPYQVSFRHLSAQKIAHYLQSEDVLQCAGSFKVEGLGISLFESMSGSDPTSLEGLPLIRTFDFLEWAHLV